jgi:membrane protein YqaA with SNARE-associated domain
VNDQNFLTITTASSKEVLASPAIFAHWLIIDSAVGSIVGSVIGLALGWFMGSLRPASSWRDSAGSLKRRQAFRSGFSPSGGHSIISPHRITIRQYHTSL